MNFFDAQDQARRSTRWLVFIYLLATVLIVLGVTLVVGLALFNVTDTDYQVTAGSFLAQQAPILLGTATVTALFIGGATLVKISILSSGGGRVAQDLGGTLIASDVQDPLRQRLRNVVEEMAIASGVPVPEIYVLEQEHGINAFAAGFAPEDAAIAVTRGTLELLDRDELQGVIAHEFSHILNGDMRLNIRLMGVLFGIMVIGLIGRMVLRGGRYGAFIGRGRDRGAPVVLIIGLGLAVLGGIGVFFARVIKARVSRQREYLADASAVQFTRQTAGLANALKKIGGFPTGSHLQAADPEEVSHMLFGTGAKFSSLFATHPPLTERIQALEPSFKDTDYPSIDFRNSNLASESAEAEQRIAGVAAAFAGVTTGLSPTAMVASVGQPEQQHIEFAATIRRSIPEILYNAAHASELAYLLSIALILDRSGDVLGQQLTLAHARLGEQRARLVEKYYDELAKIGAVYRLPLLEIAFPALRRRPAAQLGELVELAGRMINIDGNVDLYEYCFYRVLVSAIGQAIDPSHTKKRRRAKRKPVRDAAVNLLRIIAHHGHRSDAAGESAFRAGLAVMGDWASHFAYGPNGEFSAAALDSSLDMLVALNGDGRKMLLGAISAVVMFDGKLTAPEGELMRAVCASLECPLPPILAPTASAGSNHERR